MVQLLIEAQEAVVRTARSVLPLAEEVNDQPWMLRSLLKKYPKLEVWGTTGGIQEIALV